MLVEVSIVAGAVLAGAAALQHFYDRYARRGFYKATRDMATANAKAIHTSLEGLKLVLTGEDGPDISDALGGLQNAMAGLPGAITHAVSEAMPPFPALPDFSTLPAAIQAAVAGGIVEASTRVMQAQLAEPQVPPGVQAMGTDAAQAKALTKSLKAAVGADMIGPYAGILAEWAPTVYAWLQEHPDSVQWALSQPWLQGLIKKASEIMARGQTGGTNTGNPFMKDLGP